MNGLRESDISSCIVTISKALLFFKHLTISLVLELVHFNCLAKRSACFDGEGEMAQGCVAKPLCEIALWNSPVYSRFGYY